MDLCSLGLGPDSHWRRLEIPTPVRSLLCIALSQRQQRHVLTCCPDRAQPWVTLEDFVSRALTTPSDTVQSLDIPWVAYRDTLALTPVA